ncbi:MAG: FAD-dependent monooxygenase [Sulfitobacter litoralis]|jgi:2-octaprenyl-6-methoxyphenol hydroxylase|uniref:2-octaprenyl-6-methoxyphenol hydroxylase n=2 Tax=root TaxID=1 RepID=A0A1H0JU53_9RHOB|nr:MULTISPECIES: FAD-dependent monooxygenase [Sulfitobacter]MBQ0717457.1 FAD-dependent monooxygenase [Sulfitobacter litoralis]MBQ0764777.1 FAD-dependent monooxygenase [Sulfitobacter litoralis]MBQ0803187.1 FAD-dependent monooxygenase [Sulfitobacter litoralis]MCF7727629.1 2-octaprenyl-6-methoxyphenyl hydroxylase [Sulfitobacter sp. M22]MCF7776104.1 2-octaprenyl-6-methoxyphenyl hydroxylase [Sulfitobacter sp. M220]|tara:strand:+ start:1200 stop:2426 length:1227 start_codon:yes stop_codon:yes gene_type:complete
MDFDTDIAIVGGGLNGPTLALALAQIGLRVTLIDRLPAATREDAAFDGRSYALALTSTRMLGALGIWEGVKPHAQPMLEIKVTDGRAGEGPSPFFMHFDHAEIEEGPMGHMVEDRHLRRALAEAVSADARITRLDGETVVAQDAAPSGITLTFADGKSLRARLVVGADGRASGTAMRAGIKRIGWGYAQTALVCAIAHEKPHHGIAHQFFMPPGPLAILPLTDNRSSIVWSETAANAAPINALPDDGYLDVLRPRFGDFLGEISLAGARYTYPLSLSLAHAMMATRVALLGDAAHGVHPIAGQGLNAGMRDVAALAEVIADAHRRGQDIGSATVLEQYQLWRRFDNTALALATDSFNRLFSNDNPLLRLARDVGMAAINALPDARRGFMREAAGLTGTLPRLMQGKAL